MLVNLFPRVSSLSNFDFPTQMQKLNITICALAGLILPYIPQKTSL